MFVNISNHPTSKWGERQLAVAGGQVRDIAFPNVSPTATSEEVVATAKNIADELSGIEPDTAMVQGEFSLTYVLSRMLIAMGWQVVVATTERNVTEVDGKKVVDFQFVQFRALPG
jgi:glutamate dehydrogenase/leucine dehydrogenase